MVRNSSMIADYPRKKYSISAASVYRKTYTYTSINTAYLKYIDNLWLLNRADKKELGLVSGKERVAESDHLHVWMIPGINCKHAAVQQAAEADHQGSMIFLKTRCHKISEFIHLPIGELYLAVKELNTERHSYGESALCDAVNVSLKIRVICSRKM